MGVGNVVLVIVVFLEVGTFVVLSNRAWFGVREEELKMYFYYVL